MQADKIQSQEWQLVIKVLTYLAEIYFPANS